MRRARRRSTRSQSTDHRNRATRSPTSRPSSQRTFERSASRDRFGIAAHRLESPSRWSASMKSTPELDGARDEDKTVLAKQGTRIRGR
jgi:hypothetical protein